jgi:Arm DNA-binding domain
MLTALKVERAKKRGRYRCGLVKGLLLQISATDTKSWVLRYELRGREHMMGLGSVADFNLKEARERARAARQLLADRIDPLASKRAAEEAARLAVARKLTFAEAAGLFADAWSRRRCDGCLQGQRHNGCECPCIARSRALATMVSQ